MVRKAAISLSVHRGVAIVDDEEEAGGREGAHRGEEGGDLASGARQREAAAAAPRALLRRHDRAVQTHAAAGGGRGGGHAHRDPPRPLHPDPHRDGGADDLQRGRRRGDDVGAAATPVADRRVGEQHSQPAEQPGDGGDGRRAGQRRKGGGQAG